MVQCNRCRWLEAKVTLQQVVDDIIVSSLKQNTRQRKLQDGKKKHRDGIRLAGFPPVGVIKSSVKQAMQELWTIQKYVDQHGDWTHALKVEATTAVPMRRFIVSQTLHVPAWC
jgi:hypothetical protein